MNRTGYAKITVCSPIVSIGNPDANAEAIIKQIKKNQDSDIIVFPELSVTGYTCGDLFQQTTLLQKTYEAIGKIKENVESQLVFIGSPMMHPNGKLFNCAVVLNNKKIIGIVPKQNIPNYKEFYELRWFSPANGNEEEEMLGIPFGIDLKFNSGPLSIFAEICEDCWVPNPPSCDAACSGANVLVNLSASNETVGKHEYRRELIKNISGRCSAAYAYASAGPSESTTDLIFSGHCLIAKDGDLVAETAYIGDGTLNFGERSASAYIDYEKSSRDRIIQNTFGNSNKKYRNILFSRNHDGEIKDLKIDGMPFVPKDKLKLANRCAGIFDQQVAGLVRRIQSPAFGGKVPDLVIGFSGGSDSTQALLVCHKTCEILKLPFSKIKVKSMPGFGTTKETFEISKRLPEALGIDVDIIDIRRSCLQEFIDLKHKPFGIEINENMTVNEFEKLLTKVPSDKRHDLVFENVQARKRTALLMNSGFVVGTGDMSELALGWCTYNGDHMSMYNVNCSIPKTLIKFLIKYVAENHYPSGIIQDTLLQVCNLVVSPELLPKGNDGKIEQSTEDVLGPYVLHDFYLFNFVRNGFSPKKIFELSGFAEFDKEYSKELRLKTLKTFIIRFFASQFKRSCVPDGPKIGSVSLSPRGDWRMPSDAQANIWIEELQEIK